MSQTQTNDLVISGISTKFPDHNVYLIPSKDEKKSCQLSNGCKFDPHCPECIRELWGPLLAPFGNLIKQNANYFNEIIMRIGKYERHATSKALRRPLKPPTLEYDDHKFLTTVGMCSFRVSKVGWLIIWTIGFFLLILSMSVLLLNDASLSPLLVILRMNRASDWGMTITLQIFFITIAIFGIGKMFASLLGLIGMTYRTQSLMLVTLIFITILILFEIGSSIYFIMTWSTLISNMETALGNAFRDHYGDPNNEHITDAWDRIFQSYECCGWLSYSFSNTHWIPTAVDAIPHSCCRPGASHPMCELSSAPAHTNYANQACLHAIRASINTNAYVPIMLFSVGFMIVLEILCAILTNLYATALRHADRRRRTYNERKLQRFRDQLDSYIDDAANDKPLDLDQTITHHENIDTKSIHSTNEPYKIVYPTPPNTDPSLMSITPTVVQVKRPDVHSYFYYE